MCGDCNIQNGKPIPIWNRFINKSRYEIKHFIPRFIECIQHRILRWAISYIKWHAINVRHSNMIKHAQKEFDIAFREYWDVAEKDDDDMQRYMCDQIIELLALLSSQGDSGGSIGYKMSIFKRCVDFDIITPLTFKDDEFGGRDSFHGTIQNNRKSSVFKESNGDITYIDGMSKHGVFYVGEENKVIERINSYTTSGTMFIVRPDKSIYEIRSSVKLKTLNIVDFKHFDIPVYEIEYPRDWWIGLAKESELDKVKEVYDLIETKNRFEEELNWKDGKYRAEIEARVATIIDHMYPNNN